MFFGSSLHFTETEKISTMSKIEIDCESNSYHDPHSINTILNQIFDTMEIISKILYEVILDSVFYIPIFCAIVLSIPSVS